MTKSYLTYNKDIGTWGIPYVKTLQTAANNHNWFVKMNSIGIRYNNKLKRKSIMNNVIFALGDSFLFGFGVNENERFSNIIEEFDSNLKIVNFGLNSSGIDQQSLIHDKYKNKIDHDIILWTPYINNVKRSGLDHHTFQDSHGNTNISFKPYYTILNDELILKNIPVPKKTNKKSIASKQFNPESKQFTQIKKILNFLILDRSIKYKLIKYLPINIYPEYSKKDSYLWLLTKKIFQTTIKKNNTKKIIICPLPNWTAIFNNNLRNYIKKYKTLEGTKNVSIINVLPAFDNLNHKNKVKCFISPKDNHYSSYGHKVVANYLIQELKNVI